MTEQNDNIINTSDTTQPENQPDNQPESQPDNQPENQPEQVTVKSKVKKVISLIGTIFIDAVLVITILLFAVVVFSRIQGKTPEVFGYSFYVVVTGSMEPEIHVGDLIVVKETDKADIKVGDDILFYTDDDYWISQNIERVVHRVIAIDDTGEEISFTTKGVANLSADREPAVNVIGVVKAKSTFFGKLVYGDKNLVFIVCVLILLVICVSVLLQLIKAVREGKFDKPTDDIKLSSEDVAEIKAKILAEMEASKQPKPEDLSDNQPDNQDDNKE